jgi:hypothetical protein
MRLGLLRSFSAKSEATPDPKSAPLPSAPSAANDRAAGEPADLIRNFWSLQMTASDDSLQWA